MYNKSQVGDDMKKVKSLLITIPIITVIIFIGFSITDILNDDMTPPKLPIKSEENTLVITSNGCCFWVENVRVLLQDENGNQIEISNEQTVYEHDIFSYELPDTPNASLKLLVEFRVFYGDEDNFSMPVIKVENISELKKTGVLLYFQEHDDMYLNVIAGEYHASYKMGDTENRWLLMDTPNKIYSD